MVNKRLTGKGKRAVSDQRQPNPPDPFSAKGRLWQNMAEGGLKLLCLKRINNWVKCLLVTAARRGPGVPCSLRMQVKSITCFG